MTTFLWIMLTGFVLGIIFLIVFGCMKKPPRIGLLLSLTVPIVCAVCFVIDIAIEPLKNLDGVAQTSKEMASSQQEAEVLDADFGEIYDAYKKNELAAADTYEGNRYKITCEVYAIGDGGLNGILGNISVSASIDYRGTQCVLFCSFDKKTQRESLKEISMGDTITFIGTCCGWGTWEDCELQ